MNLWSLQKQRIQIAYDKIEDSIAASDDKINTVFFEYSCTTPLKRKESINGRVEDYF
jgi:hypothetical protein